MALEALPPGGTEAAVHAASLLRAHAQRGALAVGDEHGLHTSAAARGEEVLHRAVGALLPHERRHEAHLISLVQALACGNAEVAHARDVGGALAVEPSGYLLRGEGG